MGYCTEKSICKDFAGYRTVATLRCKRWSCPDCGPDKTAELRRRAVKGSPNLFLTLTIRRGYRSDPTAQARELVVGWRMLRQYLMRLLKLKRLPFLAVIEAHKSGWPHLHILLRGKYLDHKIIKRWWQARYNSFKIDIRRPRSINGVAAYVTSYVSKAPQKYGTCQRFWASRDYDPPKKEKEQTEQDQPYIVQVLQGRPEAIARMAYIDGAEVSHDGRKWIIRRWSSIDMLRWWA